jgi:hypothetical protein
MTFNKGFGIHKEGSIWVWLISPYSKYTELRRLYLAFEGLNVDYMLDKIR